MDYIDKSTLSLSILRVIQASIRDTRIRTEKPTEAVYSATVITDEELHRIILSFIDDVNNCINRCMAM